MFYGSSSSTLVLLEVPHFPLSVSPSTPDANSVLRSNGKISET